VVKHPIGGFHLLDFRYKIFDGEAGVLRRNKKESWEKKRKEEGGARDSFW